MTGIVVAMMSRAPSSPGKTRLRTPLGVGELDGLGAALLADTASAIMRAGLGPLTVLYTPPESRREFERRFPKAKLIPQRPGDLGARMHGAFEDLCTDGVRGVILVGSDLPTLPTEHVSAAARSLDDASREVVVLGPAADGGYYLVGLKRPHPELFVGPEWGSATVLDDTVSLAARANLEVRLLPPWYDVDTADDLQRVALARAGHDGRKTREWLATAPAELRERLGLQPRRATR